MANEESNVDEEAIALVVIESMSEIMDENEEVALIGNTKVDAWVLDSRATSHMTGYLDDMVNMRKVEGRRVLIGNGHVLKVEAIGEVHLKLQRERLGILKDVFYVPNLTRKMISIAQIAANEIESTFKQQGCNMVRHGVTMATASFRKGLYYLDAKVEECHVSRDVLDLLHKRFAHLGSKALNLIIKGELLEAAPRKGFDAVDAEKICETYVLGKLRKKDFKGITKPHTYKVLQLIHSYICEIPVK